MKKWFLAAAFAATIALLSQWMYWLPVQAQSGPAGINPSNFISSSSSGADTAGANLSLGDATHFTWVCGFSISGLGATSQTGVGATIGSFNALNGTGINLGFEYNFPAGATVASTPVIVNFTPCLPSPGAASLAVPGAAGNTSTLLNMWGYKQ